MTNFQEEVESIADQKQWDDDQKAQAVRQRYTNWQRDKRDDLPTLKRLTAWLVNVSERKISKKKEVTRHTEQAAQDLVAQGREGKSRHETRNLEVGAWKQSSTSPTTAARPASSMFPVIERVNYLDFTNLQGQHAFNTIRSLTR